MGVECSILYLVFEISEFIFKINDYDYTVTFKFLRVRMRSRLYSTRSPSGNQLGGLPLVLHTRVKRSSGQKEQQLLMHKHS